MRRGLDNLAADWLCRLMQGVVVALLFASVAVIPLTGPMIGLVTNNETESPVEQDEDTEEITLSRESLVNPRRQAGIDRRHQAVVEGDCLDRSDRATYERAGHLTSPGCTQSLPIRC